ncbi:MAG: efflux RND transporter periplasmic adaptor subunit [Saprospiraceae bacterium]|nr:efflux RND transporter periplasmic adaptor subunit [Saprospiraceae bacterium]
MKNILSILLITVVFAACGKKDGATATAGGDKAAQLAELKKQQADLGSKISVLEKELGGTQDKTEKIIPIAVETLTPSVFNSFIELQGSVVADEQVFLTARVPGSVAKVHIKVGDRIRAGQVVAEIDDDMVLQQMEEVKKRWELANEVYLKQESLWKQNIGSEVQYLAAKNNKEALDKTIATIQRSRELYQVKSPIDGVVDECMVKVGQAAAPGIPMATVVNFSKLKVKVDAPETYAGKIRQGNAVSVLFPDLKKELSSKISYIGATVNPANRTFKVEIPIRANEAGLLPNMATTVRVINYSNGGAIAVPINLIQKDLSNTDFVLVENAGRAKRMPVKVGQMYGEKAEIVSGLKSGDKIITMGFQDLNEGDAVKIN